MLTNPAELRRWYVRHGFYAAAMHMEEILEENRDIDLVLTFPFWSKRCRKYDSQWLVKVV